MSPTDISMFESYAARGQTAGFVLMGLLLAVMLHGLSGRQSLYRVLFGLSGLFFAFLAVAGLLEYLHPRGWADHSVNNIVACCFGIAAVASLWISGLVGQAEHLMKSMGKSAPAGTVRTTRSSIAAGAGSKSTKPTADAILDPETSWTAHAETVRLAPRGTLGSKSAPALDNLIATKCAEGPAKIVLDFRNVTSLDAAVVGAIVDCYRRFPASRFAVVATPNSAPYDKLTLLGIDQMITIQPTLSSR
jgi:anti-anti-sigma regulatory factor